MTATITRFSPLRLAEALATPHGVDRYLELVHPMLTVRELRAAVVDVRRTTGSVTLTLRPTWQWRGFAAGQFVRVGVCVDGRWHTRCYALAAAHPNLRLAVRHPAEHGRLDRAGLWGIAPWFAEAETFVCGPPALMAAARDLIDGERLHTEEFVLAAPTRGEAGGALTFAR